MEHSEMDLPALKAMPRVPEDISRCLDFVGRHPWGRPENRKQDLFTGFLKILLCPQMNTVRVKRPSAGIELRRHNAAQFAIIYSYIAPNERFPHGAVSIRAVRH